MTKRTRGTRRTREPIAFSYGKQASNCSCRTGHAAAAVFPEISQSCYAHLRIRLGCVAPAISLKTDTCTGIVDSASRWRRPNCRPPRISGLTFDVSDSSLSPPPLLLQLTLFGTLKRHEARGSPHHSSL
jgi:hypothetical protein